MADIKLNPDDMGLLCICAIRYCQGRETYMPDMVRGIVRPLLGRLSDRDLRVMLEDCDFQARMNLYGNDRIDKPSWLKWREELENEWNRRWRAMRDYEELVRELREADEKSMCGECGMNLHSGTTKKGVLFSEAADAIEELMGRTKVLVKRFRHVARGRPEWISVEERLPEHGQEVLCACRAGIYEVFKYVDGISGPWYKDNRHVYMKGFVTHWMPLPEPPKEEK